MLGDVLVWLLDCTNKVISVMKEFMLFKNLSFFDFLVFLAAIRILYMLLMHIRGEQLSNELSEKRFISNIQRYDELRVQDDLRAKEERSDNL